MRTAGIVLIVIGIVMILFTGFQFVTQKKVADVGPIEIYRDENHNIRWSPIAGAALLIGGVVMFAVAKKK